MTMKDIARELGISVSTVSRALKDSPRISPERRAEIQAYARERHFIPNAIAGTLRHSKVEPLKTIGIVVPEIVHYYFASIISGIEEKAAAEGFQVMVNQSSEKYEREVDICNNFYKYKVCGLIVVQAKDTKKYTHFTLYVDNDIPIVFCDRICTGVDASRVVVDDYTGAYNAVTHLIETGCKRIAFFGSQQSLEIFKNRFNGWKDAMLRHGLKADADLVYECDTREEAERITPGILSSDMRPDAFFAVNDDTAIGILYVTKQQGFRVPEEISICGFTNSNRSTACDPMLTTVEQRGHELGYEAADILISQVTGTLAKEKVEKRVVRTRLIVRGSTR